VSELHLPSVFMTYSLIPAWCKAIVPPARREWELSRCKGNPEAGRLRSDAAVLMVLLMSRALMVNGVVVCA
jgi:hypothetical protein